ncbi:DegT/DnrJ/EryC1/StrS family aminotransferase [Natrononativus amylolyticus]|uniref:DegT/DnrJ/EryC1/StrS family aminotransferase n=1 Tax=Natrononativus amylolyticus TaxID=2963434 RepID=UPI0020CF84FC|nr:DegT/DnrJ/EryC1/StrS family aminotransferase [Natrononativus amylolyticus]
MNSIPIADPTVSDRARERVDELIGSGALAAGGEVDAFEGEFADYCGTEFGVATSNGTTALHAALVALGVGEGDAVVTSPFSFVASANAIRLAGATPVFADVDPETFALAPEQVRTVVRSREDVAAIMPVHLYGLAANMPALAEIAADHDLAILEDACQAHGAAIDGQRVGSFGDAACFSFYPTKNMTTGEGGMITTDREDVMRRARRYTNHGRRVDGESYAYEHADVGHNFRMTDIAAAIGRAQLERLPAFNEARRENAAALDERLSDAPVETPVVPEGYRHVYHQYTIKTDDRDRLVSHLDDRGIGTGVYYPTTIPDQPAYDGFDPEIPVARDLAERAVSLPVHPGVDADDVDRIADAVAGFTEVSVR